MPPSSSSNSLPTCACSLLMLLMRALKSDCGVIGLVTLTLSLSIRILEIGLLGGCLIGVGVTMVVVPPAGSVLTMFTAGDAARNSVAL
mmetsp:Transcript_54023/g.121904  ORF Transcript_54023/g.121904 Transcript_54023/m.121904 type:complete len:88 (-) Transcript_54023:3-266(-)